MKKKYVVIVAMASIFALGAAGAMITGWQEQDGLIPMELEEIAKGDFSSIEGTWKNSKGERLYVPDDLFTFENGKGESQILKMNDWPVEKLNANFIESEGNKSKNVLNQIQLTPKGDSTWSDYIYFAHGFLTLSVGDMDINFIPSGSYTFYDAAKTKHKVKINHDAISPYTSEFFDESQFYYRLYPT